MNRRCPTCDALRLRYRTRSKDVKCDVCGGVYPPGVMLQDELLARPRGSVEPFASRTGLVPTLVKKKKYKPELDKFDVAGKLIRTEDNAELTDEEVGRVEIQNFRTPKHSPDFSF